jgi:hypothetical protein
VIPNPWFGPVTKVFKMRSSRVPCNWSVRLILVI